MYRAEQVAASWHQLLHALAGRRFQNPLRLARPQEPSTEPGLVAEQAGHFSPKAVCQQLGTAQLSGSAAALEMVGKRWIEERSACCAGDAESLARLWQPRCCCMNGPGDACPLASVLSCHSAALCVHLVASSQGGLLVHSGG